MIKGAEVKILMLCSVLWIGCQQKASKHTPPQARKVSSSLLKKAKAPDDPKYLSAYNFFKGNLADLIPNSNVYPYAINTPLFSDYAEKERFIYLPQGKTMTFNPDGPFDFETGTVVIKNFLYPHDAAHPNKGRQVIETRLLIKEEGRWKPLNYIWNDQQTEARLNYVGKSIDVKWKTKQGKTQELAYVVPNVNQCKNCHSIDNDISPIGLTAAQLNQRYRSLQEEMNQLDYFKKQGRLVNFTQAKDYDAMPVWNMPLTGSIEERAKAYLYANCAHCHSAQGSAKNSGLYLDYHQKDARARGVFKPPIAAGKGSGDFQYGIVPGKPEASIFIYRMASNDPAIRMPELGRSVVHEEGLALLRQYINELATTP
ncbi:MAG: SO2930 family diheme c-type cytochrome [Flavobacteriaceae bacterium]